MTGVVAAVGLPDVGASLREAFFMFWETLWALVLGFALSGVVQAFVSREELRRTLGDHRPASILRASGFGAVSSSCSYAATAMAKSLFAKGADFLAAMVFMFASTNLFVELGVVLVVLLGWQFAAAEFVGGPIMIVLFVLAGSALLGRGLIDQARNRVTRAASGPGGHDPGPGTGEAALQTRPWPARLRSRAGWADAASYTIADLKMLRRELVLGYLIAGFLAVMVPTQVWNDVFLQGHGLWTSVENALVGPFIALISFVCSIGNVPMAAALWHGGISFGGVVSFIFADLLSLPLLLIYRKFYGAQLTLRLLGVFWLVMATAGLLVEGLFALLGLIPTIRPAQIVPTGFHWNYTTFLNLAFLGVFALLWWLAHNWERLGGGHGYAIDPVCGMQVQTANAPAELQHAGWRYFFCSDRCRERFAADPARHHTPGRDRTVVTQATTRQDERSPAPSDPPAPAASQGQRTDPVCGMAVEPATAAARRAYQATTYWFCSTGCAQVFDDDPSRFAGHPTPR
jgi:uncharacterized protein